MGVHPTLRHRPRLRNLIALTWHHPRARPILPSHYFNVHPIIQTMVHTVCWKKVREWFKRYLEILCYPITPLLWPYIFQCPQQLIDFDMLHFEYLFWFFSTALAWRKQQQIFAIQNSNSKLYWWATEDIRENVIKTEIAFFVSEKWNQISIEVDGSGNIGDHEQFHGKIWRLVLWYKLITCFHKFCNYKSTIFFIEFYLTCESANFIIS